MQEKYSAYPGSEFPHQCGSENYGYGGYGSCKCDGGYGMYPECSPYSGYKPPNYFNDGRVRCGFPPQRPVVSDCNAPLPMKPAIKCGPCGEDNVEGFGGNGPCDPYCQAPKWWADESCFMPPQHCGGYTTNGCGQKEGFCGADHAETFCGADHAEGFCGGCGQKEGFCGCGIENFGDDSSPYPIMSTSPYAAAEGLGAHGCRLATPPPSDCDAEFNEQHKPGCVCARCMLPYSQPYAAGPGCGCEGGTSCCCPGGCSGDCACGGGMKPNLKIGMPVARKVVRDLAIVRNLAIAAALGYLAYRVFAR